MNFLNSLELLKSLTSYKRWHEHMFTSDFIQKKNVYKWQQSSPYKPVL